MNNTLVSIIIPTFNRISQLKKALNSIYDQTYQNYEIIIIDNFSIDGTKNFINKEINKNIKYFEIKNNGNIAMSRNLGIKKSSGSLIAFLDSDDFWFKTKLEKSVDYLLNDYDLTYHDMKIVNGKNKIKKKNTGYTRQLSSRTQHDLLQNGPAFPTSSVVIKKEVFEKIDLFDVSNELITWEDYDAWIRVSKITNKFKKIDETLGCLVIDGNNLSNDDNQLKNIDNFKLKYFTRRDYPQWCYIRFAKIYFKKRNFLKASEALKKIKSNELDLKNLFIIKYITIICKLTIYR